MTENLTTDSDIFRCFSYNSAAEKLTFMNSEVKMGSLDWRHVWVPVTSRRSKMDGPFVVVKRADVSTLRDSLPVKARCPYDFLFFHTQISTSA